MKTAFCAVFKVTCGRVLCVHRDVSVHTLFDCSNAVKAVEIVNADVIIAELQIRVDLRVARGHDRGS